MSDVKLVEGLEDRWALLPCATQGYPSPRVDWQREGVPGVSVIDHPRYRLLSNGTLRIDKLNQSDSAVYHCLTSNVAGSDRKSIQFDVHCKYGEHKNCTMLALVILLDFSSSVYCDFSIDKRGYGQLDGNICVRGHWQSEAVDQLV